MWLQMILDRLEDLDPDVLQPGSKSYELWRGTSGSAAQAAIMAETDAVLPATPAQPATSKPEPTKPAIPKALRLQVPYYRQRDSETDQGLRMCFSSSCAMLLATIRPGLIHGPNADDQYLARVQMYGDTTTHLAQTRALASYGVNADFTKRADFAAIERSIHRGVPVPVGYLHRGPVTAPAGGGHWAIVIGYDQDALILHDPWGEADIITGATIARTGEGVRYSRKNFAKRWMVEGPGTGWAIIAR
jgi:hypothetical protein